MGAAETRRAIAAAEKAWPAWRGLLAKERANILRRWFNLIMENQEDLARLMTLEQGKPLAESRGERSEEHTSELQSLMRISYAVLCLKKHKYTPAPLSTRHANT